MKHSLFFVTIGALAIELGLILGIGMAVLNSQSELNEIKTVLTGGK